MMSSVIKYPMLHDREWLDGKYNGEQLSVAEIAKECGASYGAVWTNLEKFGLDRRDKRRAASKSRDDGFVLDAEVLAGCLLGDGTLYMSKRRSLVAAPYFAVAHAKRDHTEYVASLLFPDGWGDRVKEMPNGKNSIHRLTTLTHDQLIPLYRAWYSEERGFRKGVPPNLVLTPTIMLHWFMDDGCLQNSGRTSGNIVLSTQGFSRDEQESLCEQMNGRWNLSSRLQKSRSGSGWQIAIPVIRTKLFLEVVGPCPVESLQYKWDIRDKLILYPDLRDPEWLYERSIREGMSSGAIARIVGATNKNTVCYWINKFRQAEWAGRPGV